MNYDPSTDYIFQFIVVSNGVNALKIEKEINDLSKNWIKNNASKNIILSSEPFDKKNRNGGIFSVIEELSCLIKGKIIHIGRVPQGWKDELIKRIDSKQELNPKKELFIDDCIVIYVEKDEKINCVIIDRRAIFFTSENFF